MIKWLQRWWSARLDERKGLPDIHGWRDKPDDAGWADYRARKQ